MYWIIYKIHEDYENQLLSDLKWHDLFPVPTPALVRKQIKSIVKRLNSRDDTEEEEDSSDRWWAKPINLPIPTPIGH